ncbi:MAG: single-stranded DNA-binding protein [bacterium]
MPELNKVLIAGRLTDDPAIKYTVDGIAVTNIKLAVNHYTKDKQEPESSFFDVVAYGKVGEFVEQNVKKGDLILVDGRLRQVKYSVKIEGEEKIRSRVEIVANSVYPISLHADKLLDDRGTVEY